MPATLLAVDDSATMRKVLEMTFAGEDFRVVTADGADAALKMVKSEAPSLVLADCSLVGKSGYDLCTAIKRDAPGIPVLLLSSKLNPYDKNKGQASGADDYIDKPFDTQKIIDKVNGLLAGEKKQVQGPTKSGPASYRAPASLGATLLGQGAPPRPPVAKPAPVSSPSMARTRQPSNLRATADFTARPISKTAMQTTRVAQPPPVANAPSPVQSPVKAKPAQPSKPELPEPAAKPVPEQPTAPSAVTVGANLASKLGDLGLTKEQIDGVLALSNQVVERVVWEVVPVLAETMIKEELKRLMDEG